MVLSVIRFFTAVEEFQGLNVLNLQRFHKKEITIILKDEVR